MYSDQWKGRIQIAIGTAKQIAGSVLHRAGLKLRGQHECVVGQARANYGRAIAAVVRRSY